MQQEQEPQSVSQKLADEAVLGKEWQLKTQQSPGPSQINNVKKKEAFNIWKISSNILVFRKKKTNQKRTSGKFKWMCTSPMSISTLLVFPFLSECFRYYGFASRLL